MKPASVINRGENFVTLRATTDRPAEIREALAARDVQHVFKGDQNQAWDAVLANHCLARALGQSGTQTTFFIHDERLGTSDARLARVWRAKGRRYVLTEDYYRGRTGAVWEHQDVSYGLFFTEAVSPEQYASASVHLHRAAELWEEHAPEILRDSEWLDALSALGVTLPGPARRPAARATGQGPAVDAETFDGYFAEQPVAALYYAFTKTNGLYGVVPVENENLILSSIPAADPELRQAGGWLLQQAARGAMRMAGGATHRRSIAGRVRELGRWSEEFLAGQPAASITDYQRALGEWLTARIFPADELELDRTSRFSSFTRADLPRLRAPQETLHFFLDLSLRHPREFTEAYNEALNRVGFGLQRIKYDPESGRYTPPFFVEYAPGGEGTGTYRYGVELTGVECAIITLSNPATGDVVLEADHPVRSAHDLARALFDGLAEVREVTIVGKAAAFSAEMQRAPRGLGLPRQGSKYTPMVDHLVAGLRARGVLDQPTGLLIRIGLNALDRLSALGELPLRLPRFMHTAFGARTTCREIAKGWRSAAHHAHAMLEALGRCCFGQHVHLARAMCLNARGGDWEAALGSDPRLAKLASGWCRHPQGERLLRELGQDLPEETVACIERLLGRRDALLARRRELYREASDRAAREGMRRVVLEGEEWESLEIERERIECELLLLFAAYVRRLWQCAESLPYVNDRPYTLALYLLFGADIFYPICREVEFDVEYVSPCPMTQPEPCVCG